MQKHIDKPATPLKEIWNKRQRSDKLRQTYQKPPTHQQLNKWQVYIHVIIILLYINEKIHTVQSQRFTITSFYNTGQVRTKYKSWVKHKKIQLQV